MFVYTKSGISDFLYKKFGISKPILFFSENFIILTKSEIFYFVLNKMTNTIFLGMDLGVKHWKKKGKRTQFLSLELGTNRSWMHYMQDHSGIGIHFKTIQPINLLSSSAAATVPVMSGRFCWRRNVQQHSIGLR